MPVDGNGWRSCRRVMAASTARCRAFGLGSSWSIAHGGLQRTSQCVPVKRALLIHAIAPGKWRAPLLTMCMTWPAPSTMKAGSPELMTMMTLIQRHRSASRWRAPSVVHQLQPGGLSAPGVALRRARSAVGSRPLLGDAAGRPVEVLGGSDPCPQGKAWGIASRRTRISLAMPHQPGSLPKSVVSVRRPGLSERSAAVLNDCWRGHYRASDALGPTCTRKRYRSRHPRSSLFGAQYGGNGSRPWQSPAARAGGEMGSTAGTLIRPGPAGS